ncbi:MAG: 8-amino-7-oxononanoate synthase [Flavobacteriaceae bacterium]|nr:8-amino-7-oxononanoate synthase [Flavobacteriaceae bacterium]
MGKTITYKIYSSTSEFPENWDVFSAKNIFLSKEYLQILEISSPENMKCNFIGLFQKDELVGIALTQFVNLSAVSSYGERDHCIKTEVRNFTFKKFSSNILIVGNNTLTGQNAFCFSENVLSSDILIVLNNAVQALKLQIQKQGNKVHLIIFKDFSETQISLFELSEFNSYYRFSTQPNMLFEIKKHWQSFDDYILDLSKKYRDQFKRARKKAEGITKRKLSLEDITNYKDRIFELYMDVAKNAPFNTFFLPENHFGIFKKALKEKFLFYGYFNGKTLIGFNTLIKNDSDIDTYFLGYDEKCQREKMLYLNMLYDMIGYSINKRFNCIVFARTALEIKSSVGAQPEKMYGFMQHSNWFINLFIAKLFRYFEPEMVWTERNPFK